MRKARKKKMDRMLIWEETREEEDLTGNEKQAKKIDEGGMEKLGKGLGFRS